MNIELHGNIHLNEKQIEHLCNTFTITRTELCKAIPRKGNIFTYILNNYPFEINWEEIYTEEINNNV